MTCSNNKPLSRLSRVEALPVMSVRAPRRYCRALSLIEMMVALVMLAMILSLALTMFYNVARQRQRINDRLERRAKIQNCLSRMLSELSMAGNNAEITIDQETQGWQTASHLTILYRSQESGGQIMRQIEWVSVPRYETQDLVLFRREQRQGSAEDDVYVPLCDGLYSFDVRMISDEGEVVDDPNAEVRPVIEILAEMYQFDDSDPMNLLTFRRTFCLNRF